MKHNKLFLGVLMILLILSVTSATGAVASASPEAGTESDELLALQAEAGWEQVNDNGFGDPDAGEITALAVFNSYLYAGTHNAADGARIFRSPDGVTWTPVVDPGFGNPHDTAPPAILDLTVYGTYLYASTGRGQNPGKIWRTSNGTYWAPVVNSGFSGAETVDINALAAFDNRLYAGTRDRIGGAQVWWSFSGDSNSWTQDDPGSLVAEPAAVTGFAEFDGALYATVESDGPVQIWRTYGGGSGWAPVMSDGFNDEQTLCTGGMVVFGEYLYAGAGNTASGPQLWHTTDGEIWLPATTPGSADGNNECIESLFVFGGQLYASVRNVVTGIEVWHSADGTLWQQSNLDGFGDSANAGSNRSNATTEFVNRLFVGTANTVAGGELWRLSPASLPSYGLTLSPASGLAGLPGATVSYNLTIGNTGTSADTYTLSIAGHSWATTLSVSSISLGPGASEPFTVHVTIPAGALANATDAVAVTATSHANGAVSATVTLTTRSLGPAPAHNLYVPAIFRGP